MIYEKLPVALLSALATEKKHSTNAVIAEYILANRAFIRDIGIRELAERCHVGTGSVSRFCKEMGLEDFAELRRLISQSDFAFERVKTGGDAPRADAPGQAMVPDASVSRKDAWVRHVNGAVSKAADSLDIAALRRLCREMRCSDKISAFGMLKAESAAISLQVDMLLMGKRIETCVSYAEQLERIFAASKDELILIFSYTGSYFDYPDLSGQRETLRNARIWMICAAGSALPSFVRNVLTFSSDLSQLSHPYQLEAVSSLIAQEYAAMYDR